MGTRADETNYPFHANVWLGEHPDEPDWMVATDADVRLVKGQWYADVFGLPRGCVEVFNVVALTNRPFTLTEPWVATVVPDDGPEFEGVITAWDGERWTGSAGPIEGMIDNPRPAQAAASEGCADRQAASNKTSAAV